MVSRRFPASLPNQTAKCKHQGFDIPSGLRPLGGLHTGTDDTWYNTQRCSCDSSWGRKGRKATGDRPNHIHVNVQLPLSLVLCRALEEIIDIQQALEASTVDAQKLACVL